MTEDWLAAWDAATEEDRRAVLAVVSERVAAASKTGLELVVEPRTRVIAARRDGEVLVVATCSYFRDCIRNATDDLYPPVASVDYHYVHVEIDEVAVEGGRVKRHALLTSSEQQYIEGWPLLEPEIDEQEARRVADKFLEDRWDF